MRFDENADSTPPNIDDLRGGGGGGAAGRRAGRARRWRPRHRRADHLLPALQLLGGGGASAGRRRAACPAGWAGCEPGRPRDTSAAASACRTGAQANTQLDCEVVAVVNSLDGYWTDAFAALRPDLQPAAHQLLQRRRQHRRLRQRHVRHRPVLLPGRRRGLHRPDVLQGAGDRASGPRAGRSPAPT